MDCAHSPVALPASVETIIARWLRPEFQMPTEACRAVQQAALDVELSAALPARA